MIIETKYLVVQKDGYRIYSRFLKHKVGGNIKYSRQQVKVFSEKDIPDWGKDLIKTGVWTKR